MCVCVLDFNGVHLQIVPVLVNMSDGVCVINYGVDKRERLRPLSRYYVIIKTVFSRLLLCGASKLHRMVSRLIRILFFLEGKCYQISR